MKMTSKVCSVEGCTATKALVRMGVSTHFHSKKGQYFLFCPCCFYKNIAPMRVYPVDFGEREVTHQIIEIYRTFEMQEGYE